jgi:hypothetical protein
MTTPMTREEWLITLAEMMRPVFADLGYTLPEKLRVSVGWPSSKALAGKGGSRAIGQCFYPECSKDKATELFISPVLEDGMRVADTLAHELAHAALGKGHGHGPKFARVAKALGLEGKPTNTVAGEAFIQWAKPLVAALGKYPHAALDVTKGQTKQSTRMLKVSCPECGYSVRTTQKWLDVGTPTCPCGEEMEAAA